MKFGYPPKPLPITDGVLSSIPITKGEQIIVTSVPASEPSSDPAPASLKQLNETLSAPSPHSAQARTPVIPGSTSQGSSSESVRLPGRDAGFLQLRVVPDDNSCLFSAIGVVFNGGIEAAGNIRRIVADEIQRDEENWSEVVLG